MDALRLGRPYGPKGHAPLSTIYTPEWSGFAEFISKFAAGRSQLRLSRQILMI